MTSRLMNNRRYLLSKAQIFVDFQHWMHAAELCAKSAVTIDGVLFFCQRWTNMSVNESHRDRYLTNLLLLTSETHSRQTRYAKFNIACPRVKRNTEGGRTFTVTACREWNKLPLQMRKAETLKTFKNSLWNRIFKDQQFLNHFSL